MSQSTLDNKFMEFRLGDNLFAIPLLHVKEVIKRPEISQVPNMPAHFEGMLNLRGQILGVFNVRQRLGAKKKDAAESMTDVVVVVDQNGVQVGMIVDEVTRVLHATQEMIKEAPLKEGDPARKFVNSVIQSSDELVLNISVSDLLELDKYNLAKLSA